ncbi:MAG: LamG domain protein jellyroll fold domain protein, partial [Acidobacteria bacterium]|nr:LamG domain protein jellyroll fold domain protein [Acidobacteriota bacterium]
TLRNLMVLDGGEAAINGTATAGIVSLANGGRLSHAIATATSINRLSIIATSNITVDPNSSIDVSFRGLTGNVSSVAYTYDPSTGLPTLTGGASSWNGGAHGGAGGQWDGPATNAYGSLYDPNEPGAAGSMNTTCSVCISGGGVARIKAPSLVLDGSIKANGQAASGASAAGGSIRVDADAITGVGQIHADGGLNTSGASGGGGRVALYFRSLAIPSAKITAASAAAAPSRTLTPGAAGTVYLRRVDASGAKLSDELVVDNAGVSATLATTLANAGNGTVTAINGNVITLSNAVPFSIESSTIELLDAASNVVSSYTITARTANSVTVDLAGEPVVNAAIGTAYRGVTKVDKLTLRGGALLATSSLSTPLVTATGASARLNDLHSTPPMVLDGGTLEVNGTVAAPALSLTNGVKLSHSIAGTTTISRLNINVAGAFTIDALSSVDVTGVGIAGNSGGVAYTYDPRSGLPTLAGGASGWNGGSHGGVGGQWDGPLGVAYGSLFDPNEPGAAGSNNGTCVSCNSGGGVIRIAAGSLHVDGTIAADGLDSDGAGAGGSVRIDAATISGSGHIHANGGRDTNGASGAGGRVALYYNALTVPAANITVTGAASAAGDNRTGAAGTLFLKSASQTYGSLFVDNGALISSAKTTLTSVGNHVATQVSANSVTDSAASFETLTGIRLAFSYDVSKSWPIVANNRTTATVTPDAAFQPVVGTPFRGLYRFDRVTLVNARVETDDVLISETPLSRDAASTLVSGNIAPPSINVAAIHIAGGTLGQSVIGSAGAVADPDAPLTLLITNTRTAVTTSTTVAADGSFVAAVGGKSGDVITARATDSHRLPLTSAAVTIGVLTSDSATAAQVTLASFGVDAAFRPRALAMSGRTLAVISDTSASSDKVALFDTSAPLAPVSTAVVSIGDGANRSVVIDHGWVFVGATRLNRFQLGSATPTVFHGPSGSYTSLAVLGRYLYAARANNTGLVQMFDIANPASPVDYGSGSFVSSGPVTFTSLVPIGTKYLAGISADKTNGVGHDVVIWDVHDTNIWYPMSDFDVPSFDASRGVLSGNTLHLVSATGSEEVLVNVADVTHPVVLGRVSIGQGVRGVDAAALHAYAAVGDSVAFIDAATATAPQFGSALSVGGNANDVRIGGGAVYVAHDAGLAIISADEGPVLSRGLMTITANGANAVVTGTPGAIVGGSGTVTLELRDGAASSAATTNADDSFVASVPATPGDELTIKATDGAGRAAGPIFVGTLPIPPLTITAAKISFVFSGGSAAVTGIAGAIGGGKPPVSVTISDRTRILPVKVVTANADGSFTGSVSAFSGDFLGVAATDDAGTSVGPLIVGRVTVPLAVNTSLISIANVSGTARITGAAGAITGTDPITVFVTNGPKTNNNFVAANGSFTVDLAGVAGGDPLTLSASDGAGANAGPLAIGSVPIGLSINKALITVVRGGIVTGTAGAVSGHAPLTITLQSGTVTAAPITANADGSFIAAVAGAPGDHVILTLSDGTASTLDDVGAIPLTGTIAITTAMTGGDGAFRARTLAIGGNTLVIASYPDATGGAGSSAKLLVFDVTDSTNPIYRQTYTLASAARAAVIDNGWAFVGTNDGLSMIDLASNSVQPVSCNCASPSTAVAVLGNHAYTINGTSVVEYDITTRTATFVSRSDDVGPTSFRGVVASQDRYLALLAPVRGFGSNNLRIFDTATHDVAGFVTLPFAPFRGRAFGTLLYVVGETGGEIAIDLSNPQQPVVLNTSPTGDGTQSYGVDAYGTTVAVAGGTIGAYVVDATTPAQPSIRSVINEAAPAWDVAYNNGALYVASETALYIATAQSQAPVIDASRIRVTGTASSLTITGSRGAVAGAGVTAIVAHGTTSVPLTLQYDGSFTAQFAATSNETLTIRATDNVQRTVGPISLGRVPYGSFSTITAAMADSTFRARQLVLSGTTLLVAGRETSSDAIVVYDVASPSAPLYKQTLRSTLGAVQNMTVADGRAYVSYARGVTMIDLRNPTPVVTALPAIDGTPGALAVAGHYLFISTTHNGATSLAAFDIADPAAIRLQSASVTGQNTELLSMIALDPTHLAAAGAVGSFFADVSSAIEPGHGFPTDDFLGEDVVAISSDRLFMTSAAHKLREWRRDETNGDAITTIATAGAAHGIDAAGTTLYVADGAAGLSIVDATTVQQPALLRSIPLAGTAWDARIGRGVVYVAADGGVAVIGAPDLVVEPAIDARAISAQTDGVTTATVTGTANAIASSVSTNVHVTSGANTSSNTAVDTFGAFAPLTLTAAPGGALVAHANTASKSAQRPLAPVPFANGVTSYAVTAAKSGDANARFRRIALDGTRLVATHGYPYNSWYYDTPPPGSDALFIFDTTQPIATQTPVVIHVGSHIDDLAVANGIAYVAAGDFVTVELATGAVHRVAGHGGALRAVTVSGT